MIIMDTPIHFERSGESDNLFLTEYGYRFIKIFLRSGIDSCRFEMKGEW